MAKHTVEMSVPGHDIGNCDVDFWIWSDETLLGHLHVSKGGIDWYEGKASLQKRSLNWETFAAVVTEFPLVRAAKPKRKRR